MFFKRKQHGNGYAGHDQFQDDGQFGGPVFSPQHQQKPPQQHFQTNEPSVIAADLVVNGQIKSGGDLHINGTVLGSVEARTCVVEPDGRVEGEIRAQAIFVHGQVMGPLNANHIHVFPGAVVRGDIIHETINIESGADVLGQFMRQGVTSKGSFDRPARAAAAQAPSIAPAPPPPIQAGNESNELFDTIFVNGTESQSNQAPISVVRPKAMKR